MENAILIELVKQIVGLIAGGIITYFATQKKKAEKKAQEKQQEIEDIKAEIEKIKGGLQALMRDRLEQGCKHYAEKKWVSLSDKANIMNMHHHYENLGENGVINDAMNHFRELPNFPPDEQ